MEYKTNQSSIIKNQFQQH